MAKWQRISLNIVLIIVVAGLWGFIATVMDAPDMVFFLGPVVIAAAIFWISHKNSKTRPGLTNLSRGGATVRLKWFYVLFNVLVAYIVIAWIYGGVYAWDLWPAPDKAAFFVDVFIEGHLWPYRLWVLIFLGSPPD
jgi:hypothetical protein